MKPKEPSARLVALVVVLWTVPRRSRVVVGAEVLRERPVTETEWGMIVAWAKRRGIELVRGPSADRRAPR